MKIRSGFVSNSSSSSFIINPDVLTKYQHDTIMEFIDSGCDGIESWSYKVDERKKLIFGSTSMDNYELSDWLELKGWQDLVKFIAD